MMKFDKDVEDLNLDFSDRSIDKPKAFQNLVYEFRLNGDSSGASSLESLDFGFDDGFIFDHQLDFPAVCVQKDEPEVENSAEKDNQTVTSEVDKVKKDITPEKVVDPETEVTVTPSVDIDTSDVSVTYFISVFQILKGNWDDKYRDNFPYFSMKIYVVTHH